MLLQGRAGTSCFSGLVEQVIGATRGRDGLASGGVSACVLVVQGLMHDLIFHILSINVIFHHFVEGSHRQCCSHYESKASQGGRGPGADA